MRARRSPNEQSFEWLQAHDHARTVPCPAPPRGCGQPAGQPCLTLSEPCPPPPEGCGQPAGRRCHTGDELTHQRHELAAPAHAHRLIDAAAANPAGAPTGPAVPVDEPRTRAPHLVAANRLRRDLAAYREACDHCHLPIVWATNPSGDRVPVDADPTTGNEAAFVTLHVDDRGVRCVLLKPGQVAGARAAEQRLHVPHRETCRYGHLWSRFRK